MTARPAPFKAPDVKRAVSCALSLGLKVTGFEIGTDGRIIVHTSDAAADSADADLEKWKRSRNG
ncbi:hypothetical protein FAZ78_00290 [Cereibacter changlensis]|uniref:Uncharacterized protein n=1 Tax=Cereibacter changlensis TaxID=402884 RepID=A0A4U0Z7C3_9RHOB|nr:hypothetical protein [Cereibacter changlensis]TKA98531.1 hypothetical protein FAZ78_00290 [Cereibacter changlensis]